MGCSSIQRDIWVSSASLRFLRAYIAVAFAYSFRRFYGRWIHVRFFDRISKQQDS